MTYIGQFVVHIGGINWELQKEIYGIGLPLYHE
jgi:hypothetical protein